MRHPNGLRAQFGDDAGDDPRGVARQVVEYLDVETVGWIVERGDGRTSRAATYRSL